MTAEPPPAGLYVEHVDGAVHIELGPGRADRLASTVLMMCGITALATFLVASSAVTAAALVLGLGGAVLLVAGRALQWPFTQASLRLEVDERGLTAIRHHRRRVFRSQRWSHADLLEASVGPGELVLQLRNGRIHRWAARHRTEAQLAWTARIVEASVAAHRRFEASQRLADAGAPRRALDRLVARTGSEPDPAAADRAGGSTPPPT